MSAIITVFPDQRARTSSPLASWMPSEPSTESTARRPRSRSGMTVTVRSGESTKDFAAMMWAQMGVMMMFAASGSTIGPPADIEYAVEPVGVAIITPSPAKLVISVPVRVDGEIYAVDVALDHGVVQGAVVYDLAVGPVELYVEHHAQALAVVARGGAADELDILGLQPGHEALGADVHAQQRDAHAQDLPRDVEEGAVPAEGDYELRVLRRAAQRDHVRIPGHVHEHRGDHRLPAVALEQLPRAVCEHQAAVAVGIR